MTFVHEDRDFDALLRIVADKRRIALGLVEKDYWVTHALWALQDAGFEIWFKGGTSLSKGFGLIERFSEDLDLKLEPGRVAGIPPVTDWKRGGKSAVEARRVHFEALARSLAPPGMTTRLVDDVVDEAWRSANIQLAGPRGLRGGARARGGDGPRETGQATLRLGVRDTRASRCRAWCGHRGGLRGDLPDVLGAPTNARGVPWEHPRVAGCGRLHLMTLVPKHAVFHVGP